MAVLPFPVLMFLIAHMDVTMSAASQCDDVTYREHNTGPKRYKCSPTDGKYRCATKPLLYIMSPYKVQPVQGANAKCSCSNPSECKYKCDGGIDWKCEYYLMVRHECKQGKRHGHRGTVRECQQASPHRWDFEKHAIHAFGQRKDVDDRDQRYTRLYQVGSATQTTNGAKCNRLEMKTTTIGQTEKRFETRDGRKVFLFHSGYNPLSTFNFGSFVYNEQHYYNLEQFYQVQKAKTCGDSDTVIELLRTKSAKRCKEIGRNTQNYDPELWEAKAEYVMYAKALERFMLNATYRDYLKATGNAIIGEATRFDNYWAIGLDIGDTANEDVDSWPGRNSYGQILMRVREGIMNLDKKRN